VVFGRRDANDNLILGAPSDIAVLSNPQSLEQAYTQANSGAGPYTTTITVTTTGHGLVTGNYIVAANATGSLGTQIEGVFQVTVLSSTQFTYTVTTANIVGAGNLDWARAESVRLEFSIPSECESTAQGWFYQIYRSGQQDVDVGIFSDFKLIEEKTLSSAELTARVAFYIDDVDDILLGSELYTNENTREGELQANFRPPLCDDLALYKNHAIYGRATTRQLVAFDLVDPTKLANGDYILVTSDVTVKRYVARTGVGNSTVIGTGSSSSGLLVTYTSHGLSNGDTVYVSLVVGAGLAVGTYYVVSAAANTFKLSLTSGGAAIAYTAETQIYFEGVTNGTYPIFQLSQSSSASVRLRDTASGLIRAINRDSTSLVYGQYISGPQDVPGKMRLQAKGFIATVYVTANTTTAGTAFSPELTTSTGDTNAVKSTNDVLKHCFFSAKQGEPEAVPLVNFFAVGAKNKAILRVVALRDSLIIIKEDGIFRVTGDTVTNFVVTPLDTTVFCVAPDSVDIINNQVPLLSNQGVCLVTESSVAIISRKIESAIQPILGQADLAAQTTGVAYESERLYLLTTTEANTTTASITWAYNTLTDEWSSWDTLMLAAALGPADKLYYVSPDNRIYRERKQQTKLDFCGQNYDITVTSVSSDKTTAVIVMPALVTPEVGDVIVKGTNINRIKISPVNVGGTSYLVTFYRQSNLEAADTPILYARFESQVKFAPFHAGLVGRAKHFAQFQAHTRGDEITRADVFFTGDSYNGSESVTWYSQITRQGWGFFPWGFEPFGQPEGINLAIKSAPGPILRVYVPRFQARNSFIQAFIVHNDAAEQLELQAVSWSVRSYGERVSK
jgi:hypothetical protein